MQPPSAPEQSPATWGGRGALTLGVQKAAVRNLLLGMAADLAEEGVHAATLTVRGVLAPGTAFEPDLVAARLVALAAQRHGPGSSWSVLHELPGEHDGSREHG